MDTRQTLVNYIRIIQDKETDVYGLIADVDRDFRALQVLAVASGITNGAAIPNVEWLNSKHDEIYNALHKAIYGNPENNDPGLQQFIAGMNLPVTLIDIMGKWKDIANDVTLGQGAMNEADLRSSWTGRGADNYQNMRLSQQTPAFTSMVAFANGIANELQTITKLVVNFYDALQKAVVKLVKIVKDFSAAQLNANPIKSWVDATVEAAGTIVDVLGAIMNALTGTTISQINIVKATQAQIGFGSENKWPSPPKDSAGNFTFTDFSFQDDNNDTYQWKMVQ
ncbi:hypothetical protein VMT65_12140 [Nocardia sp. CDC153]|uniref:hypothetical protein n=1 Tax=Nocardia sp. CDC153 TaxID=3112167 RepID=UPI002DBF0900|nr:hypothetical protein [Nocardia sp. CDC153]MEC3953780.1 hypothetical protein [Nocardia sp. CDC153]